jgi:hypothetical protein
MKGNPLNVIFILGLAIVITRPLAPKDLEGPLMLSP